MGHQKTVDAMGQTPTEEPRQSFNLGVRVESLILLVIPLNLKFRIILELHREEEML